MLARCPSPPSLIPSRLRDIGAEPDSLAEKPHTGCATARSDTVDGVSRVAIVVPLKDGVHGQAEALISEGPPFALRESGIDRHAVYLTNHEVVFVFEGPEIEWKLDDLVGDAMHPAVTAATERWLHLLDGEPRVARETYFEDASRRPGEDLASPGRP